MKSPTVLIVPGLRDHAEQHWQTHLERELLDSVMVAPMGRTDLDCAKRVSAIETAARSIEGPLVIVAHSGGVVMVAHWAQQTKRPVLGALLATPPDFEAAMPEGYPTIDALRAGGWLPVPRGPLPFRSIVAASRNDPLASFERVRDMAEGWGSELFDLGDVGHLNPASGFGPWPRAVALIDRLQSQPPQTSSRAGPNFIHQETLHGPCNPLQ